LKFKLKYLKFKHMPQDPMKLFIDKLMAEAGLDNLPEDYRQEYENKLRQQVDQRIGLIAMGALDEQGMKDFEKLADSRPDSQALKDFFAKKIPNFGEKVRIGLAEFAQEFIAAAKK